MNISIWLPIVAVLAVLSVLAGIIYYATLSDTKPAWLDANFSEDLWDESCPAISIETASFILGIDLDAFTQAGTRVTSLTSDGARVLISDLPTALRKQERLDNIFGRPWCWTTIGRPGILGWLADRLWFSRELRHFQIARADADGIEMRESSRATDLAEGTWGLALYAETCEDSQVKRWVLNPETYATDAQIRAAMAYHNLELTEVDREGGTATFRLKEPVTEPITT